jgi:hypothetical protein
MTDREKMDALLAQVPEMQQLAKAIEKAIAGGWTVFDETKTMDIDHAGVWEVEYDGIIRLWYYNKGKTKIYDNANIEASENDIIFDHDFAKALWGDKEYRTDYSGTAGSGFTLMPSWMAHLQNMVIAEDPIKYLGDYLI